MRTIKVLGTVNLVLVLGLAFMAISPKASTLRVEIPEGMQVAGTLQQRMDQLGVSPLISINSYVDGEFVVLDIIAPDLLATRTFNAAETLIPFEAIPVTFEVTKFIPINAQIDLEALREFTEGMSEVDGVHLAASVSGRLFGQGGVITYTITCPPRAQWKLGNFLSS